MTGSSTFPVTGFVTTCTKLNVRSAAPSVSAAIAARIEIGSQLLVCGIVSGDSVEGNAQWYAGSNDTFFWAGGCGPLIVGTAAESAAGNGLAGHVESAPPGALGFDIDRPLSARDAAAFQARGFRFCVRYLSRSQDHESPGDLSRAEADAILNAGLALMAVQHVAKAYWIPTADLGRTNGTNAVRNAQEVGLPAGVNIWLDLEGVRGDTPRQDVIDYCNAWFAAVSAAGYATGLYVGDSIVLSPDDLYWNLRTQHYWKSGSNVPDIPIRGYQMLQRIPPGADDDTNVDTDVTQNDAFGGSVQWLSRA
ncbi:MAG TPA: DUF1906 domain-containing protein [Rhizomicrobium sp.]|jgi:hypothetical protein